MVVAAVPNRLARLARRDLVSEATLKRQGAEVRELRKAAQRRLEEARAAAAARSHHAAMDGAVGAALAGIRERIDTASTADWRELAALVFPRRDGLELRLYPDGRIGGRGTLPLTLDGVATVRKEADKIASSMSKDGVIFLPVRWAAR